ncbi:MAG: TolC family protein [Candidatus Omnitrophota bacterium]
MHKILKVFIFISLFSSLLSFQVRAEEVLAWKDCVKEAQKNHPDLISAQEEINQSIASKEISKSGLLPQVSVSAGASTDKSSTQSSSTKSYDYGISTSQLLFDGFKTSDNVGAASENIKAAKESYRFSSSDIRARLRRAFINLLRTQEMVKVAQDISDIRRSNLILISLRYESGLEHRGALLTAEANVAEAKLETEKTKRELVVFQRQLIKEMGRSESEPVSVEGDFEISTHMEKPDLDAIAKNNPSLKQLSFRKNAARYGIKSAYAEFFPQLSGRLGANRIDSHFPPENDRLSAGLTLSWPIFEGGLKAAQLNEAQSLFKQYEAAERSTKDEIILNLEDTWAALQDAAESVQVQKKFLEAAEERAKIAEAEYSLGLIQFNNWTIIEDDLVRNKRSLLELRANALLAESNWILAKGETLEYVE